MNDSLPVDPQEQLERLQRARTTLVIDAPFFGFLALRMPFQQAKGETRTMATDGRSLLWDPQYVASESDELLVSGLKHEVLHCALKHHLRCAGLDLARWNKACDYPVNEIIVRENKPIGKGWLLNPAYYGLASEDIYQRLPQDQPQEQGNKPGKGKPSQDKGQGTPPGQEDEDQDTGNDPGAPGGQDGDDAIKDMPGAFLPSPDPVVDEPKWTNAVKQAAKLAKMMGRLPGDLEELVEEITRPRVDWRSLLRRFMQQHAAEDYSMRRPNPRYIQLGFFMPALESQEMGEMAAIVDSSASTAPVRDVFNAELQEAVNESQPEATHIINVDCVVQSHERVERGDPIVFKIKGNGGTEFEPGFRYIEEKHINPVCAVYLTDGEGIFPKNPPPYPVMWFITNRRITAPWGESVHIEE